ncbi:hypothetical protein Pmani_033423 [Petrolisthes manimaculis]|uniref:Uncharacterized protein n=1 Tax=Petrolisthes manimaculis TaxID=1843537 RepID=A0AAE1TSN3_9EUCA|nr:hypothetical protein Pmani_033423 [Petrolisthes manimaculis]
MDTVIAWITSAPTSTDVQSKVIGQYKREHTAFSDQDDTRQDINCQTQPSIHLDLHYASPHTLDPWMELYNPLKRSSSSNEDNNNTDNEEDN